MQASVKVTVIIFHSQTVQSSWFSEKNVQISGIPNWIIFQLIGTEIMKLLVKIAS